MASNDLRQVVTSTAHVNPEPSEASRLKIEMLFGERVTVLEDAGEWMRVRTVLCEYEGYIRREHLGDVVEPTHRVSERLAAVHHEPYFKGPTATEPLYFNSLVTVEDSRETGEGLMHKVQGSGWIYDTHVRPLDFKAPDFLSECLKFLGTMYGYEKRGALIDCSTLVQAGCIAAGIACPYDVKTGDMELLGDPVDFAPDYSNLQRGDLVFWTKDKGSHVVIMVDQKQCLHATTAHPHHRTLIQSLVEVAEDQARDNNGPITAVRRFPGYSPG